MSLGSTASNWSTGSRPTIFVPPLSSPPSISDLKSETSSNRRTNQAPPIVPFLSSHRTRTVDDTVLSNQQYLYPGGLRAIQRGSSLLTLGRARGARPGLQFPSVILGGLRIAMSSGPTLERDIRMTPPPSTGRGGDRAHSEVSDEAFLAGTAFDPSGARSFGYYSCHSVL